MNERSDVHALLPWYVNGTLDPEESDLFEDHMAQCEACRRQAGLLEQLQQEAAGHGNAFFDEHPDSEQLVDAIRGDLYANERSRILDHIDICGTCSREALWIQGHRFDRESRAGRSPQQSAWRWRQLSGAAAVLLLAILGVWGVSVFQTARPTGPIRTFVLDGATRGETALVEPAPGERDFQLILNVDLPRSGPAVGVTVVDASGTTVYSGTAEHREQGFVVLYCRRDDFPDGAYQVQVSIGNQEAAYAFRVRERG